LLYHFADPYVRRRAVEALATTADDEFEGYLLQLVQVLRFEVFDDSPLARLLLERGLRNQRVGLALFWHLKTELETPALQRRAALLLEAYCFAAGTCLLLLFATTAVKNGCFNPPNLIDGARSTATRLGATSPGLGSSRSRGGGLRNAEASSRQPGGAATQGIAQHGRDISCQDQLGAANAQLFEYWMYAVRAGTAAVDAVQRGSGWGAAENCRVPGMGVPFGLSLLSSLSLLLLLSCFAMQVMDSKKKPLWLQMVNGADPKHEFSVLYKRGDDLRQDMLTIQMLQVW
jgi:hypothetical protein